MRRVLKSRGIFFFNGYSKKHTSASAGKQLADGRTTDIRAGSLTGVGSLGFNSMQEINELFEDGWKILSMEEVVATDYTNDCEIHAEWKIIAQKYD